MDNKIGASSAQNWCTTAGFPALMQYKAAAQRCQRTLREYLHSVPADALPGRGPLVYACECGVHLFKAAWASAEAATAFGRFLAVAEMTGDMRVALLNRENTVVLTFKPRAILCTPPRWRTTKCCSVGSIIVR